MRLLSPTLAVLAALPFTAVAEDPPAPPPKADITQEELDELHRQLGAAHGELARIRRGQPPGTPPPVVDWERLFPGYRPADDELLVVVSRRDTSLLKSPVSAAVLDEVDFANQGHPTFLRDRLSHVPGVTFWQNGGVGGMTSLSLRGANSWDTSLQLDGIPVTHPAAGQGQVDLAIFPSAGVNRIEVLKGAQSAVHGSRAVGGVVDVQTLRPTDEFAASGRGEAGSMGTVLGDVRCSGPLGDAWGYAFSVEALSSDGISKRYDQPLAITAWPPWTPPAFSTPVQVAWDFIRFRDSLFRYVDGAWVTRTGTVPAGDPDSREADGLKRVSLQGRLEFAPAERFSCYAAAYGVLACNELDNFYPVVFATNPDDHASRERTEFWRTSAGGRWEVTEGLTLAVDGAHGQLNQEFPHVNTFNMDRNYDTRDSYASGRLIVEPAEPVTVTLGVDWHREEADFIKGDGSGEVTDVADYLVNGRWAWYPTAIWYELAGIFPPNIANGWLYHVQAQPLFAAATTTGVWGEVGLAGDDYEFTLAGRADFHSREGDGATGRAAGAWLLADGRVKFRGAAASGFRAPSLFELYSQFGNPGLEPQLSTSYEGGIDLRPWEGVSVETTVFRTDYRRLIYFYSQWEPGAMPPSPASAGTGFRNLERDSYVKGWETRVVVAPPQSGWELEFGYTRLHSNQQREDGSNRPMTFIPEKTLTAAATVEVDRFRAHVGVRHVGKKAGLTWDDIAVPVGPAFNLYFMDEIPSHTVVDAAVSCQVTPHVEVYVRGENLLDEDYVEVRGYSTVRPSGYVGIKGTL